MTEAEPTTRTRLFRNKLCPIVRTVRNVTTGAVYDLITYDRQVTNRRDGTVTTETLTRKLRRPGTGVQPMAKEVEVEVEIGSLPETRV